MEGKSFMSESDLRKIIRLTFMPWYKRLGYQLAGAVIRQWKRATIPLMAKAVIDERHDATQRYMAAKLSKKRRRS